MHSPLQSFSYQGGELEISKGMKDAYERDGFLLMRNLWNKKELGIIEEALVDPQGLSQYSYGNEDGEGKEARMCLWSNEGNDTTGTMARTQKMVHTAQNLLGGQVFHYHSKLMMKEAYSGGRFHWHQDYGYWYNFAFLFPDMITAFIAIDKCDEDNGCLQIVPGSHKCGRLEHDAVAGQTGADPVRVEEIQKLMGTRHVVMSPGDVLFFHCNLLHSSAPNLSSHRRWAILSCYSRIENGPYKKVICAEYHPLDMTDNDAVIRQGVSCDLQGKEVLMKIDNQYQVVVP